MPLNDNNIEITKTEINNELLAIKWSDNNETLIKLYDLRDNCPCASCVGEKDVLGNLYKGTPQKLNKNSYRIISIKSVGRYGIRPIWADGHSTGIFTYEFLLNLCTK